MLLGVIEYAYVIDLKVREHCDTPKRKRQEDKDNYGN